jgi:polysaccharide biosynthesis/export protein
MRVGNRGRNLLFASGVIGALSLSACASHGPFVWVQSLPVVADQPQPYVIAAGDSLDIRVYNEERLSSKGRVRLDGKISLPLLGEVHAAGKSPVQLAQEVQTQLTRFLQAPTVTVQVDDVHALSFTMMGEIARPGVYPLPPNTGLLQALALGGGLTQYADADGIFILRRTPAQRIRVTYQQLMENEPHAVGFKLIDGDVIVIE